MDRERELYTIAEFAALKKVSENEIEDRLRQGLLFCTVKLNPKIYKEFVRIKDDIGESEEFYEEGVGHSWNAEPIEAGIVSITTYANERRDDEFLLQNYYVVVEVDEDSYIDLKDAKFKTFRNDGFIYKVFVRGSVPNIKRKHLFISKEEDERFESACKTYYTLEEVASLTDKSPQQVFEMTIKETEPEKREADPVLWPSAYFHKPIKVQIINSNKVNKGNPIFEEIVLSGYLEVEGERCFLKWESNDCAMVAKVSRNGKTYCVTEKVNIHKNDILISEFNLEHYWEMVNQKPEKSVSSDKETNLKGGAPKGPLAEAVEFAYLKFQKEGNTEILRKGKIQEFLERFKEMTDEDNRNFSDYVAERIQTVKISHSGCSITTEERSIKRGIRLESRRYSKSEVSKQLTNLRKKYPLPT